MTIQNVRIVDVYPNKAQFYSGEQVALTIELINEGTETQSVSLKYTIFVLDQEIENYFQSSIILPSQEFIRVQLEAGPYATDFTGYGVEATIQDSGTGTVVSRLSTAFDVVSDWRKAPRYGFLSDFGDEQRGDQEDVRWMAKLHLNLVQFYDWLYRPDQLVSEENQYTDLMGREISADVVKEKIQYCHEYGMKAFAYGAIYSASQEFADAHAGWRIYTSSGEPYDFIGKFHIMNISPDSPWHQHIVNQYKNAITMMDFDGIHMDTYGFPKTGWSTLGHTKRLERLEEHFPPLIESTRTALSQVKNDIGLIFNNVGNWPVDTVARSSQDAIYIEVWNPYERYDHLAEIIYRAKIYSGGKPVILSAYLKPFCELGEWGIEGAEHSFCLLNAVVTANQGYHLLHGEFGGILTQGYYVDYSQLRPSFMRTVRNYADFGVRYGHVFFDHSLRDVSMTHAAGDNLEYQFTGFLHSTYGEAGKVWTIIKENESMKLIHFVNLSSAMEDYWNESKPAPTAIEQRMVSVAFDGEIDSLFVASPDYDGGKSNRLPYHIEKTSRGNILKVKLPTLLYWDALIIKFRFA